MLQRSLVVDLRNFTGRFERGETFLRAKSALVDTAGLSVHIKFTKARGRDINGYYRWEDRRMVLAVKQRLRYPRSAAYGVGTRPRDSRRLGGVPYSLVWHEERFDSEEDLLVFVAGHEFWHFLCHSGQRKRDHETRANCHGFVWLREFRAWAGPGCPVADIPLLPPRPDLNPVEPAAVEEEPRWFTALPVTPPRRAAASPPRSPSRAVLDAARQLLLFR
ncbi:MAG: hypothetical protein ABR538_08610 [Candidatus Binatia bacterium]